MAAFTRPTFPTARGLRRLSPNGPPIGSPQASGARRGAADRLGRPYAIALLSHAVRSADRLVARGRDARRRAAGRRRLAALQRQAGSRSAVAGARRRSPFVPLADARLDEDQELAAANARIVTLPLPADVVALGMGDDGHTASWFPRAEGLAEAMDLGARALVAPIHAAGAPEPRLTLTGRVLLRARAIALHIEGADKLATLDKASAKAGRRLCRSAPCCARPPIG